MFKDNIITLSIYIVSKNRIKCGNQNKKALNKPFIEYYGKHHVLYQLTLLSMLFIIYWDTYMRSQHVLRSVAISQDVRITNNHEETSLRYSCSRIGIHYTALGIITKL